MKITVKPTENKLTLSAKRALAEQARNLNRDPNAASSVAELKRVVADLRARLEWLEEQIRWQSTGRDR